MALIKCSECGGQVSDKATVCPHCGCPVEVDKFDPNIFVFEGVQYDISNIVEALECGDINRATGRVVDKFPNHMGDWQKIEVKIWNQFKKWKECQTPDVITPSSVLSYEYNGIICDATRSVWWLDRGDRKNAFIELYFGFPYGHAKNGPEEQARLRQIVDDLQSKVEMFKEQNGSIVYPRWFLQWKKVEQQNTVSNLPKCPTCGSTSLDKITAFDRGVAGGLFGFASKTARSQFRCKKCGYMW